MDPIKQAENLLSALLIVAKSNLKLFSQDALDKLNLINQIDPNAKDQTGLLINDVWQGVDNIVHLGIIKTEHDLNFFNIGHKTDAIISALQEKPPNQKNILRAYEDLGKLIQDKFPQLSPREIHKILCAKANNQQSRMLAEYQTDALPPILAHKAITLALPFVSQYIQDPNDKREVRFIDALSKGTELFKLIMSESRVNEASSKIKLKDEDAKAPRQAINEIIYKRRINIAMKSQLNELMNSLDEIIEKYKKTEPRLYEAHAAEITNLLIQSEKIATNEELTPTQKYDLMMNLLIKHFNQLKTPDKETSSKNTSSTLFSHSNTPPYIQLIGLLLRDTLSKRYSNTDNEARGTKLINEMGLDKLSIPDNNAYKNIKFIAGSTQPTTKPSTNKPHS